MASKFSTPRGTRDFMPKEMARREYVFSIVKDVFSSFGFKQIETPAFESWELLGAKGGGGQEIKDDIYLFKDKGGREMGLRFDLTVPTARLIAQNPQLLKPFKRFQIGRVWRYDKPQAGRYREFWQADVDIFGSTSMAAEAECIAVFSSCLDKLGFRGYKIKLNNRKILNGIVDFVKITKSKAPAVFRAMDKLDKLGMKVVKEELSDVGIELEKIEMLFEIIETAGKPKQVIESVRKILSGNLEAEAGLNELEQIVEFSKGYGTSKYIEIDFSLVRGLEYYSGPIFEITVKSDIGIGSVAGGGRYDNLIGLYGGPNTPATGFSLGIERIMAIMQELRMFKGKTDESTKVFIATAGDELKLSTSAIELSNKLRDSGIKTETDVMGRKLKQSFEYAEKSGIPYVIVVGDAEIKSSKFTLKELKNREQKTLKLEAIIKLLKK